ncbi:hypothetical protein [Symmachiella dynata]|uniref:hypothetical protein n=1 Tax=Symmachiella dynata TaxID=2527995 RepID=UPI0030EE246C
MAERRKYQAKSHVQDGKGPAEISSIMGITIGSVIQYLQSCVGEGLLRLSDIYFSIPSERRELLKSVLAEETESRHLSRQELESKNLTREEVNLFKSLRTHQVFAGDMYEYVSDIEVTLHATVREVLEEQFGKGEYEWWRLGIPRSVRVKCAERYEEDDDPSGDAFVHTDLIHLAKIIRTNWNALSNKLPDRCTKSKTALDSEFSRLNRIRNAVMHPVKQRKWSEDDFQFVRNFREQLLTSEPQDQGSQTDGE